MRSLLHQLENNEAVLLMYLAGELPAEDRADVEQQLTTDGGLRAELEQLRSAENLLTLAMSEADGVAMPPVTEAARQSAAVRRVSRAMVRYQLEVAHRAPQPQVDAPARGLRLPAWSYPFAAAAIILVGFVGYWGFSSNGVGPSKELARDLPRLPQVDESDDGTSLASSDDVSRPGTALMPSLGMEEGDRNLLAISAGSYDVSSMFKPEHE